MTNPTSGVPTPHQHMTGSSSTRSRSGRTWRQAMTSALGYGNSTPSVSSLPSSTNSQPHPTTLPMPPADENEDDNAPPSRELLEKLKGKEFRLRLESIFYNLVMARRTYLNHADENWQTFLDRVQEAYEFFEGGTPQRGYRDNFTIENYRMLFQRESSAYRDDVCRGVKRIRDGMWVNGEEVKFPQGLVDEGFELAARGERLMDLVFTIDDAEMHRKIDDVHPTTRATTVQRFIYALRSFDRRYVIFEKNYIEALIAVEKQSRSLVQRIAELIQQLDDSGEKVNQELLDHMAELNKKSRDCFNCKYNFDIMRTVLLKSYEKSIHERLWYLPAELLERFEDICIYLKELLPKILRVHPKLEHNPGLVQRLEKFHDTYQRVCEWVNVQDNPMSNFCHFLDEILSEDQKKNLDGSVDTILLIPRLFCLYVWHQRMELESGTTTALTRLVHELHPELLVDLSRCLCGTDWENGAIEDLAKEVVERGIDRPHPSELSKDWEVFSMQLQRNNPSAWNSFVSVILHEDPDEEERNARPRLPSV
ncbi:unnamed protein product [Amoebophrya sp. A25]|nr:unnamed protein product [Amoebophrya sp. A25]|eukprot:GSA25T00000950001.1